MRRSIARRAGLAVAVTAALVMTMGAEGGCEEKPGSVTDCSASGDICTQIKQSKDCGQLWLLHKKYNDQLKAAKKKDPEYARTKAGKKLTDLVSAAQYRINELGCQNKKQ